MLVVNIVSLLLISVYFLGSHLTQTLCWTGGSLIANLLKSFLRSISHANTGHLFFNLASFRNISEKLLINLPSHSNYSVVLGLIWLLEILFDFFLMQGGLKVCSIGFSGVVFGLLTYFLMHTTNSYQVVIYNVGLLILPGLFTTHISNVGHLVGALIGLLVSKLV